MLNYWTINWLREPQKGSEKKKSIEDKYLATI